MGNGDSDGRLAIKRRLDYIVTSSQNDMLLGVFYRLLCWDEECHDVVKIRFHIQHGVLAKRLPMSEQHGRAGVA